MIRVVIADDSEISAEVLERLLEEDPDIRVVGRARTGAEILTLPERAMADAIVLDVLMPELGGLSVLRSLSRDCRVIVVSSVERDSAVEREALALGANSFFSKRGLTGERRARHLRDAVKGADTAPAREGRVVFVVGSTGAIMALERVCVELAATETPILVVQHLPPGRDEGLADLLSSRGGAARVARHGDFLEKGALVAPFGQHLAVGPRERVCLVDADPVNGHRPSGEVLLRSALPLARRAIALMLSGLGRDGAEAMGALAERGGACFALDPKDCKAPSMPRSALAQSSKVRAVKLADLGRSIRRAAGHGL